MSGPTARIARLCGAVSFGLALGAVSLAGCGGNSNGSAGCGQPFREPLNPNSLQHVIDPSSVKFDTDPPTSGPHLFAPPPRGVVGRQLLPAEQVTVLEAGDVLVQYRDAADATAAEALRQTAVTDRAQHRLEAARRCDRMDLQARVQQRRLARATEVHRGAQRPSRQRRPLVPERHPQQAAPSAGSSAGERYQKSSSRSNADTVRSRAAIAVFKAVPGSPHTQHPDRWGPDHATSQCMQRRRTGSSPTRRTGNI